VGGDGKNFVLEKIPFATSALWTDLELLHKCFDVGFDIFCTCVAWMVIVRVDIFLIFLSLLRHPFFAFGYRSNHSFTVTTHKSAPLQNFQLDTVVSFRG